MINGHFCTVLKFYIKDIKNNVICIFIEIVMLTKSGRNVHENNSFIIRPNNFCFLYYHMIATELPLAKDAFNKGIQNIDIVVDQEKLDEMV